MAIIPMIQIGYDDEKGNEYIIGTIYGDDTNPQKKIGAFKKEKVPGNMRWSIWERDNFTCKQCGSRRDLTIDHILAEANGGPTILDNLQTLCRRCNSRKGSR